MAKNLYDWLWTGITVASPMHRLSPLPLPLQALCILLFAPKLPAAQVPYAIGAKKQINPYPHAHRLCHPSPSHGSLIATT